MLDAGTDQEQGSTKAKLQCSWSCCLTSPYCQISDSLLIHQVSARTWSIAFNISNEGTYWRRRGQSPSQQDRLSTLRRISLGIIPIKVCGLTFDSMEGRWLFCFCLMLDNVCCSQWQRGMTSFLRLSLPNASFMPDFLPTTMFLTEPATFPASSCSSIIRIPSHLGHASNSFASRQVHSWHILKEVLLSRSHCEAICGVLPASVPLSLLKSSRVGCPLPSP